MFNIKNDIKKYEGIQPYASELYGIHQALLGWRSKLTKDWLARRDLFTDPRIISILNGQLNPGPTQAFLSDGIVQPLKPGMPKSPFKVLLTKDWNSELMLIARDRVQEFVDESGGKLPQGEEWQKIVEQLRFDDADNTALKIVQQRYLGRLRPANRAMIGGDLVIAQARFLAAMQFESQIADFLVEFAQGLHSHKPDDLAKLFAVQEAPPLEDLLRTTDPLAQIDPKDTHGAISPIGFVHIFRQYFFDLGSFLGEPVEHIWLAPGTTIELIETSSRRVLTERTMEELMETTLHTEHDLNVKDEISEAIKSENQSNTKFAVSATASVTYPVFQGSSTASFGSDSTRKDSRETSYKNNRETTEKIATDLKRSFKTSFKTVTENIDTRSRRHVIQNTTPDLVNYELRRKMRRVGVQLQDMGTRLCWQVYVDDPGENLGLAEMVDLVESPDLSSLKNPDHVPYESVITKKITVPFPYKPVLKYYDTGTPYAYWHTDSVPLSNGTKVDVAVGLATNEGNGSNIVIEDTIVFALPRDGYKANSARLVGVPGGKIATIRSLAQVNDNSFRVVFERVSFGNETAIALDWEVDFVPVNPDGENARIKAINDDVDTKYNADKARLLKHAYLEAIRKRIKDVNDIKSRPTWDLREEERTIIYRKLIEKLMLGVWKPDHDADTRRVAHLRSEVIRSLFDVDALLYFVAPEWWKPREHASELVTTVDLAGLDADLPKSLKPTQVAPEDRVSWTDDAGTNRKGNYKITEDSTPARLGSSLGWLLQLDGDNLRNAFLNSPWVKAVLPIRPGREEAALNWLRSTAEGEEGLDEPYSGTDSDPDLMGKTLSEALDVIAARMANANGDFGQTLATDKVFETGFNPLDKSFDASLAANEVFSQWISIVPTDQIVAQKYEPTELFTP